MTTNKVDAIGEEATGLEAEATKKKTVPMEFRGHTYTIPAKLKMKIMRFVGRSDLGGAIDALLGDEQATVFWDRHDEDDIDDCAKAFFDAVAELTGGNS